MKSLLKLRFVLFMFVVSAMFFSCQRNSGTNNTDTSETSSTVAATTIDTTEPVAVNIDTTTTIDTAPAISPNPPKITDYSWILIEHADGTFGYEVMKSGNLIVSQPHIPGEGGTTGFARREQAGAAAELVISKLEQDILPPSISEKELKKIMKN